MGAVRHRSEASSNIWRICSRSRSSLVSADGGRLGGATRRRGAGTGDPLRAAPGTPSSPARSGAFE
uniref:Pco138567b n=1 Tax=Arundo donax TaxID=35708 RepID=A0A0A9FZP5_ARUDO